MIPTPFPLAVVVDDDPDVALAARLALRGVFDEVVALGSPAPLPALLAERAPDAVLLDLNFGRGASDGAVGFEWLARVAAADPDVAVVVITAHGGIPAAVEAIKRGATDFVAKPWSNERLAATARSAAALTRSRRAARLERGRAREVAEPPAPAPMLGRSAAMARVHSLIERAAPTDANVLILGENGTGKELVAREIHRRSRRADRPLVAVDLGAIAESLFDAELFGHVKGAFTDARTSRVGRMPAADGGTLFLDEIGNLPLHLQPKLLTALEQRRVTPVGANQALAIDVRVIAATNLTPERLADERHFRQDLLFRLNTVEIEVPPLRRRRDDVAELVAHFVAHYARKYGKPARALPPDVLAALQAHDWPGNVRALRHAAERAVILAADDAFTLDDFSLTRPAASAASATTFPAAPWPAPGVDAGADLNLERAERQIVEAALKKHAYNISHAAAELGLTRASLYRRMEKHGL